MIHTAEEILEDQIAKCKPHSIDPFTVFENMQTVAIQAINEARTQLLHHLSNATYIADNNHHKIITETEILAFLDQIK